MFQENLRNIRLSFGLTQKELAEELGTSQQSYMKWETGKTSPTLTSIKKIAQLFDIPVSQLVSDNSLSIENILDAEYIEINSIPLKQSEIDNFKSFIENYIRDNLKHYHNLKTSTEITLKSGKKIKRKTT